MTTPQPVVDALQIIAAYLRGSGHAEAVVSPTGGASFHLTRKAEELLAGWQKDRDALMRLRRTIIRMREGGHELPASLFRESLEWEE